MTNNAHSKLDPYWPRGLSRVQAASPDDNSAELILGNEMTLQF
jgi:hypothetical protein